MLIVPVLLRAAPPLGPAAWALMWSDEFDGASLDATRWKWGALPWGGTVHSSSYASAITAADSYLEGGVLKLRCRKVTTDGKPWTEGFVHTQGKLDFTYGYAEIRAKYPHNKGTWPAFWMLSWSSGWPPEIDVAEYFGSENRMHHGLCTGTSSSPVWDSTNAYDEAANWHTYGIEWAPGSLKWYRDDVLVKTVTGSVVPAPDMYLILNSGMNDSYDSTTPNPNYYQVDYVRVYQRAQTSVNGDFESGNAPWSRRNGAGVMAGEGIDATSALRILTTSGGDGAAEQTVYGLLPDTDYIVSANVRSNGWATLNIGAKNYGGPDTRSGRASSVWGIVATPFTTAWSDNSARVYAWLPAAWATGYVDDFHVTRAAALMNASLETGEESTFWDTAGDVFVHNWSAYRRSGEWAMRFNNPAADRSAAQFVAGLKPSTTYQWSCWMRTHNQLLRLGARDQGDVESFTGKTGLNWTWTRLKHTFTTGAANTTATVFATIPAANHTSVVDIDDFFLAESLPTAWSLTDIGTVDLESEAGPRGLRFALRASGTGPGGTADSMAFVHQALAGDGNLVARLRTVEGGSSDSRSGIAWRASTAAGARGAWLGWRGNGTVEFIRRTSDNAAALTTAAAQSGPCWLRLHRRSNTLRAYTSTDGLAWMPLGAAAEIEMPATAMAGLACASGYTASLTESSFSDLAPTPADSDADGLDDDWELRHFAGLARDGSGDADGDGFSDLAEFNAGSSPSRTGNTPVNVHSTARVAVATSAALDEWTVTDNMWTKTRTISPGGLDTATWVNGWFYAVAGADVVRINPASGTRTVLASRPLAGWTEAQGRDIEAGPDGRLYFATAFGSTAGEGVYRINPDGSGFERFIARSGGTAPNDWELNNAIGLAWIGSDLYVSSRAGSGATNRPIYRFNSSGGLAAKFAANLTGPMGLCPDGNDLVVGGTNNSPALVALKLADGSVNYSRTGSFSVDVVNLLGELHAVTFSSGAGGHGSILKSGPDPALGVVNNDLGGTATDLVVMPVTDYEAWALDHGIHPLLADGRAGDDYDHDGTTNAAEFALGLDPSEASSRFAARAAWSPSDGVALAWPSRPGLVFTVLSSADLAAWTVEATVPAAAAPASVTLWNHNQPVGSRRFYRIEFTP